jgi:hypothetical protein
LGFCPSEVCSSFAADANLSVGPAPPGVARQGTRQGCPGAGSGHPVQAIQAHARSSRLPCDPFAVGLGNRASEDTRPWARLPGPGLTFRDLSHVGVRASIHRVLPQTDGADPLLGFHLPRVFSLPATAAPHCVASSHALRPRVRRSGPVRRCLRVSVNRKVGWSLVRLPTLSRFPSSSSRVGPPEGGRRDEVSADLSRFPPNLFLRLNHSDSYSFTPFTVVSF